MWGGENFLKIAKTTFLRYDVGRKFRTVKETEAILCFAIFGKNSKWSPYVGRGKFLKIVKSTLLRYPEVENFGEIPLSHMVKEIEEILCFAIFWEKFENSKWPPFLGRGKFFENCQEYIDEIPFCLIISTKSLYLAWLRR